MKRFKTVEQTFLLFANRARSWSLSSHAKRIKTYVVFTGKNKFWQGIFSLALPLMDQGEFESWITVRGSIEWWRRNSKDVSIGMYIHFNVFFRWIASVSVESSVRFQCDCLHSLKTYVSYSNIGPCCVSRRKKELCYVFKNIENI